MDSNKIARDLFKSITIKDELHIAAIDQLFIVWSNNTPKNVSGMYVSDGRWVLAAGRHLLDYGNSQLAVEKKFDEKGDATMKITTRGWEAARRIFLIINAARYKIDNEAFINAINNFIMRELDLASKGRTIAGVVPEPMDGIYAMYHTTTVGNYLLAKKELVGDDKKVQYTIDMMGDWYKTKIDAIINGDANRIRVVNCSIIAGNINVRLLNKPPLASAHPCQQTIIDYILNTYQQSSAKNVTILVSGTPGLGKSTIGFLVAQQMKDKFGIDPYLIKGFNVNSEEMQYHPIIGHYNPQSSEPIVLLLDEFDIAMSNAENPHHTSNSQHNSFNAISANKTNLNAFLDAINDESYLITVATTNMTLAEINEKYGVYCRSGRFHMHFEMTDKNITNICKPSF